MLEILRVFFIALPTNSQNNCRPNDTGRFLALRVNNLSHNQYTFTRDMVLTVLWLLFVAVINQQNKVPVISIFPYLLPVAFIAWRYGIAWGFVCTAIATLAALPGEYVRNHDMDNLYWVVLTTYFKLTGVVIGIVMGKNIASRNKKKG